MSDLVPIDPALLALMHGAFGKDGALLPFAREIMLIECHIAGTSHRDLQSVEPSLAAGSLLVLKREAGNPHDTLAIMLLDTAGHHLGYVPRVKNEALARLMDAGKMLFGRLEAKEWVGPWLKIEARIFLRDFGS
ncbi:MAG: HIRAN domain-containing protein [Verrucomicrobiales bacterium]